MAMKKTESIFETIPQVFNRAVDKNPSKVAMRTKQLGLWHDITWHEYHDKAKKIGCALASMGFEKGDAACIIGDNSFEWVMADMAIQCVGGVSVGVYATNAWQQVQYVVDHCDARFLFVENEEQLDKWLMFRQNAPLLKKVIVWDTKGLLAFTDPMVMTFDQLLEMGSKEDKENPSLFKDRQAKVTPDDLAVIIYTSGTTGPPKGAMLTHKNVTWMASAVDTIIKIHKEDNVLSFLPLCHVFERLFTVFIHIKFTYVVNFVEKPDTVMQNMMEVSPTVGYAVPRIWEKYYSNIMIKMDDATWFKRFVFKLALKIGEKRADRVMNFKSLGVFHRILFSIAWFTIFRKLKERLGFENIRVAISGAAPISKEVLRFFQSIGMNLIEGYGQTEGTGVTTLSPEDKTKFGTVGIALKGIDLKIAEDGEILVKSPGVFKGYYKSDKATAETIVDGWLLTGDVGEIDSDGFLKITDRKKDIIVTAGGKNITPQYIENKLKASIYINDTVVIGDKRKFLSCLIMIDEDNVAKFAQDNKIQFSTYKDLTCDEQVIALIDREVKNVNETLARVENIRKFTILPKRLYEEDGEVTPTMKIKRKFVNKAFKDLIEAMY
ncbi:MAG: long-chain fatty acid--CoA ligase [Desulfobacula sp.]|nr:long-chain fatty acid--CoA ligase [Desulfobacula sp.]MBT3486167.1 long-chain fatty acid--CoA ligase [Desulfobacula sp.]MBT3805645.1 long-chain fatty acid--CoA ligase [Desulfobacula sp.]MBT4024865.1 long-chain fatty acid--CoA ligase [Desulfobacula sp.]MBT4198755.1 long-chain fatty acid--CoA ligase [Desulfobacula sp.]